MKKIVLALVVFAFVGCGPVDKDEEPLAPSVEVLTEEPKLQYATGNVGSWNITEPVVIGDFAEYESLDERAFAVSGYDFQSESRINVYFAPSEGGVGMVSLIFSKSLEADELKPGNNYEFDYTQSYADAAVDFHMFGLGCTGQTVDDWDYDAPMGRITVSVSGDDDNRTVDFTSTWYNSYDEPIDYITGYFDMVRP